MLYKKIIFLTIEKTKFDFEFAFNYVYESLPMLFILRSIFSAFN